MSLAMAPPMVTKRVPGETGTKNPRRHDDAQQLVDADTGRHGDRAARRVEHRLVRSTQQTQHQPAGVLRGVAVAATQTTHQRAAVADFLERCRHLVVRHLEHVGDRGVGEPPAGQ